MFFSRRRIQSEDALKHLLDRAEAGAAVTAADLSSTLGVGFRRAAAILENLRESGSARLADDGFHLTPEGRTRALALLRRHRLYETWLARHSGRPPAAWHRIADRAEHRIDDATTDTLADRLGNPRFDPHGDPIPTREGTMPALHRVCLASWPSGVDSIVEHIEDEPPDLFRQIDALDLHPGMILRRFRLHDDGSVALETEGRPLSLPPQLAALIQVGVIPEDMLPAPAVRRLSDLRNGEDARIDSLSPACTGAERNRLLDMGLVPGTAIRCEFASPFGSPRAYFVRGTLVALRHEQAERILVRALP